MIVAFHVAKGMSIPRGKIPHEVHHKIGSESNVGRNTFFKHFF